MPGVHRKGDKSSGHQCDICSGFFPPRVSAEWSPNVFANGKNVERINDQMEEHCCNQCFTCHIHKHVGSHNVYANSRDIQTCGDPIDCPIEEYCAECSGDVFIN